MSALLSRSRPSSPVMRWTLIFVWHRSSDKLWQNVFSTALKTLLTPCWTIFTLLIFLTCPFRYICDFYFATIHAALTLCASPTAIWSDTTFIWVIASGINRYISLKLISDLEGVTFSFDRLLQQTQSCPKEASPLNIRKSCIFGLRYVTQRDMRLYSRPLLGFWCWILISHKFR